MGRIICHLLKSLIAHQNAGHLGRLKTSPSSVLGNELFIGDCKEVSKVMFQPW